MTKLVGLLAGAARLIELRNLGMLGRQQRAELPVTLQRRAVATKR